jgi:peptidoglycan hydrolase-like protein with peptidoglycan-binding domain
MAIPTFPYHDLVADPAKGSDVNELHAALARLGQAVAPGEVKGAQVGPSTQDAVRAVQQQAGLPVTGTVDPATARAIADRAAHAFITTSKTRTARLHEMLGRLGLAVAPAEQKSRTFGPTTDAAVRRFQTSAGMTSDARVTSAVFDRMASAALAAQLSSKTQIAAIQRMLIAASRIGKLGVTIAKTEIKARTMGSTSAAAVRALQTKYKLPVSGTVDVATYTLLVSIVTSRPRTIANLNAPDRAELATLPRALRLNMVGPDVYRAQRSLAFLGYHIKETEAAKKRFGPSTRLAVMAFQARKGLIADGHLAGTTRDLLNQDIIAAHPAAAPDTTRYRVRGSVRDNLFAGQSGLRVTVVENGLEGPGTTQLGAATTLAGGFYDLSYPPPRSTVDNSIRTNFQLLVRVFDASNAEVHRKLVFAPTPISWVNFTAGDLPFAQPSLFARGSAALATAVNGVGLDQLVENDTRQDITFAAVHAKMQPEDVMRFCLALRVAKSINVITTITPEVVFAFLRQHLPPSLPSDLLSSTQGFTLIDALVENTSRGIVFMDAAAQAAALTGAVKANLVGPAVSVQSSAILAVLATVRTSFALNKPILAANGTLHSVLAASAVPAANHDAVANLFIDNGGMTDRFWDQVTAQANSLGGAAAISDLRTTAELASISKNHPPTMTFLRAALTDTTKPVKTVPDYARLDHPTWVGLITANGSQVPAGTPGHTTADQVDTYATILATQAALRYPGVAAAATTGRTAGTGLDHINDVTDLLAGHPDLDLAATNVDSYLTAQNVTVAAPVRAQLKLLQRVHRISTDATTTAALIASGIHSATQLAFLGRTAAVATLAAAGVDARSAATTVGKAEFQYAQALAEFTDYRLELHQADPAAIIPHVWTKLEEQNILGQIPDLAELFGSLDFCDCANCVSLTSPAAYLVDVLRFLSRHPATAAGQTAADVLLARRQDLANIKLNSANTDTPMPYVDLICEVLEGAVPAPDPAPDFAFQSTLPAAELRAFPEHARAEAYGVLSSYDGLGGAFNAAQEEVRTWLAQLGVPRPVLMATLQSGVGTAGAAPADASIAAEAWGLSTHDTALITATTDATAARQTTIWGFDATRSTIGVAEVLTAAGIGYEPLEQLIPLAFINGAGTPMDIDRPDECDISTHTITAVTPDRLDRMARFIRLQRRTGWANWQLDALLRAPRLAQGHLDGPALDALARFGRVRTALNVPFDNALALYADLAVESHLDPADGTTVVLAFFTQLFANPLVASPVDPALTLPLAAGQTISAHRPAVLAGLAVTEADLDALLAGNPDSLTVANLSRLYGIVLLARSLGRTVPAMLTLLRLLGADPLASPRATQDLLDAHALIAAAGLSVEELSYLLELRPDAPVAPRDETIAQFLTDLRGALQAAAPGRGDGQIVSAVAALTALTPDAVRPLLAQLAIGARSLFDVFRDPALVARDGDGNYLIPATRAGAPDAFHASDLLVKASLLLRRLSLTAAAAVTDLFAVPGAMGVLSLGTLPATAAPSQPLLPALVNLIRWRNLRQRFPEPEGASLRQVLTTAGTTGAGLTDVQAALAALTGWTTALIGSLHSGLGLQFANPANDYTNLLTYERMAATVALIHRAGVDPPTAFAWAQRDAGATAEAVVARQARQAARATYSDGAAWLAAVPAVMDPLREGKRDALVAYLLDNSRRTQPLTITINSVVWPNPLRWNDPDDLLRHFLIDVEMSACQLTSRIKQGISSTQMFVQSAFLNLEQPQIQVSAGDKADKTSPDAWSQWTWMKSYRMWEAARKVFLYPENWIRPELRDDKTPFFKELESELQQGDLTADRAEAAFTHYLEKVHEVGRVQVLGVYHEVQDDPEDLLPPSVDTLHVVVRTITDPSVYYYRAFDLLEGAWSPYERIDVDITGDHLTPVVYNRKLHLFWLVITEKPQKMVRQPAATASASATPTETTESAQQLELQLAWSVRTRDGWTNKRLSRQKLIHPWQRPLYSYSLKPRYKSRENQLWMDVYISVSPEFNEATFYDPWAGVHRSMTKATKALETLRPWHSSSFVFDGGVVAVKMRALNGFYHLPEKTGLGGLTWASEVFSNSLENVNENFGADGRAITGLVGGYENAPRLPLPIGMHYRFNRLTNNVRSGTANPTSVNVLDGGTSRTIMTLNANPSLGDRARGPFELAFSPDHIAFDTSADGLEALVYSDERRSFFILPEQHETQIGYSGTIIDRSYRFRPFYHPYTALFLRELGRSGIQGLLNRNIQTSPQTLYPGNSFSFTTVYQPSGPTVVEPSAAADVVDFDRGGAYAAYNWEIFFQAPFLIACRLMENQQFEDALTWFHYIFDPTSIAGTESPQRFWVTKPFFDTNSEDYRKSRIENLLAGIGANLDQLRAWRNDPFNPHRIARLRPVAYQKTVVMRYLDNLIGWGDSLFRQDTIEAINEATLLYVLAQELLGPRPTRVPAAAHTASSWNELTAAGDVDEFGQASIPARLENLIAAPAQPARAAPAAQPLPLITGTYFTIPPNDVLLGYWSTVAARLFNIRNCRNIGGTVRQLPLFEPPIDPALLVKAAAAVVDLGSVASPSAAQTSPYRYRALSQKANELCAELRAIGEKVLSILDRRDGEDLARLRASHESTLLTLSRNVRQDAIDEATQNVGSAQDTKALAESRRDYYRSREFMSAWETTAIGLSAGSAALETTISVGYILAGGLRLIPDFVVGASGFGGSPHVVSEVTGGDKTADAGESAVASLRAIATSLDKAAALANTMGSYQRRQDDWTQQGNLADTEVAQADKQILAAQIRQALAQHELDNLELQIDQASTVEEFLRSKYTNTELYSWMLDQLATLYFQAYTQAFEMAQRAEAALVRELGRPDLTFVQFGYWDSMRKGLMAGERLGADLARMDAAYLQANVRELELTKHISLAEVSPLSLLALKAGGSCTVVLPEWLFDLDFPGQYRRRIKSVAVSIPCVAGPWTGVHATLTLNQSAIRMSNVVAASYGDPLTTSDPTRFAPGIGSGTVIATSTGQNDSGVFELSAGDERYLPFEHAGAVSTWTLTLPARSNNFNVDSITDVIIHLRYTAVAADSAELTAQALSNLDAIQPTQGSGLIALKNQFSTAWSRFLSPAEGQDQELVVTIGPEHLPFFARGRTAALTGLDLFVEAPGTGAMEFTVVAPGALTAFSGVAPAEAAFGNLRHATAGVTAATATGPWRFKVRQQGAADFHSLTPDDIRNVYLVIRMQLS